MADALPPPLVPADCDLSDFQFIPVDVRRLLTSETWVLGTGDERAAAMTLWLVSWHQVPAGSLPKDDRMLAHLSQAGVKWKKVKEHALRGWIEASDGRLYHPVVAEKALEAWIEKLANSLSGSVGNARRWGVSIETESIRKRAVAAIGMLRVLAPQSKALKKKMVAVIEAGSQPESGCETKESGGDDVDVSGGDSGGDRKGQGQGQGLLTTTSANAEGAGTEVPRPEVPNCPHKEIIALYHELLPMCLQVRTWNSDRQKHLQARWREDPKRQSLDWWQKFFDYCAKSEFLTGRAAPARDRDPFVVSLDWLVSPKNFAKTLDGRYHKEAA